MCLAVPGKVEQINEKEQQAVVDYTGVKKTASLMLCPQVQPGDYVLVHAGFCHSDPRPGLWSGAAHTYGGIALCGNRTVT